MSKLGLSLPTTTVPLCTNLGLVAEHEKYVRELQDLERENVTNDERENSPRSAVVEKIRALETQMKGSVITFTLSALPKKLFAEIENNHQPREDNKLDQQYGINLETGPDALLSHMLPATIVSVIDADGNILDFTGSDWKEEADGLSNSQWSLFAVAVLAVNRGSNDVPFSRAASREMRRSEQK